jgi:hypothetical protein
MLTGIARHGKAFDAHPTLVPLPAAKAAPRVTRLQRRRGSSLAVDDVRSGRRWAGLCLLAALSAGCGDAPSVSAEWRMADRTVDRFTDRPLGTSAEGPDGIVDRYDHAQGALVRGRNGNVSTRFPADGLYDVVLDACATSGATRFAWSIDGGPSQEAPGCQTTVRLSEGPHEARLLATSADGAEAQMLLRLEVRDLIVVGLGDSFSAGSGNSRGGLVSLDYDNVVCTRSGRSGQAMAALELEKRDPHTSVTFIHLSCGGARASLGFLRAHNEQAPQILELSQILPAGQSVDFLTFTIGGNDVRFSEIIGQLIDQPDAPLSLMGSERTHDRVQRLLLELRETMSGVAACFGTGFENRPCEVVGPSGRDDDLQVVRVPPIPLAARDRVVHITYPDLTTRWVRDLAGNVVRDASGVAQIETCPSGAVEAPGDLLDGVRDGMVNGQLPGGRSPVLSRSEWAWGDAVMLAPEDPAPGDRAPATYVYTLEAGGGVALPVLNTLNSLVMESRARFGWTSSDRWWRDSRGRGYCSPASDNWFYRSIFHPNDAGYAGEAPIIVAEAERLGVVPAR